jgi:hypothetical protein
VTSRLKVAIHVRGHGRDDEVYREQH